MGSGSTGEAAMLEGKTFIGFEIDPDFYEKARSRLSKLDVEDLIE
jgi:DNA modification methylase